MEQSQNQSQKRKRNADEPKKETENQPEKPVKKKVREEEKEGVEETAKKEEKEEKTEEGDAPLPRTPSPEPEAKGATDDDIEHPGVPTEDWEGKRLTLAQRQTIREALDLIEGPYPREIVLWAILRVAERTKEPGTELTADDILEALRMHGRQLRDEIQEVEQELRPQLMGENVMPGPQAVA
uniref:AAA family ATPase n=1 Tax=Caenorhabditis tropicalis TaxID=1561998 RepID=A0A1I7TSJ0_9PELO